MHCVRQPIRAYETLFRLVGWAISQYNPPLLFYMYHKAHAHFGEIDQGVVWIEWVPFVFVTVRDHKHARKRPKSHYAASAHRVRWVGTATDNFLTPTCQNSVDRSKKHCLTTTPFCAHVVGVDTFFCKTTADHPILFILHPIFSRRRPLFVGRLRNFPEGS